MADTYTDFLNLVQPEIGAARDAWGGFWNENAAAIDAWAAATDKLAKAALSRDQEAVQAVAGHVRFLKGVALPQDVYLSVGESVITDHKAATDIITGNSNAFRVFAAGYKAEYLAVAADLFNYKGRTVWHAGNFTPSAYYNREAKERQELSGPFSINMPAPYFDLTYGNVMRLRQIVDGNGTWIVRNGDNADNFFYVTTGGAVWTKQFGDLNARIEARAAAFADDRLATARAEYAGFANRVARAGDTMTGDLEIQKGYPNLRLHYPGVRWWQMNVREWGGLAIQANETGDLYQFRADGSFWTSQLGDLNSRIEARAAAFADDRLNTARAEMAQYGNRLVKTGDTMTGDLTLGYGYPNINFLYPGVRQWQIQVREDGQFYFYDQTGQQFDFMVKTDGGLWCRQLGDIGNRIETRAAAFADDRLASARTEMGRISGRLAFAGDLGNDWNANEGMAEPYGGAVITSRATTSFNGANHNQVHRWRYMQMCDYGGTWYTVGYV